MVVADTMSKSVVKVSVDSDSSSSGDEDSDDVGTMDVEAPAVNTKIDNDNTGSEADNSSENDSNENAQEAVNEGWADSLAKILGSNKPKNKKTLVLSRAKKHSDIVKKSSEKTVDFEVIGEEKVETQSDPATATEPAAKKKKLNRPSFMQFEELVNFLEQNPDIAKGHLRSAQAKWESKRKWDEITLSLNAMGGTNKDAKGWSKCWSDKKYALKKKIAAGNASAVRTGGGTSTVPPLSDIEERMLALLGGRGFAEGSTQFGVPLQLPKEEQPTSQQPDSMEEEEVTYLVLPSNTSPVSRLGEGSTHLSATSPLPTSVPTAPRRSSRIRARVERAAVGRARAANLTRRSQLSIERDRLVNIEEKRVDAEQTQANTMREAVLQLGRIADTFQSMADAIRTAGSEIAEAIRTSK